MNVRNHTSFLHRLISTPSPSGWEDNAIRVFSEEIEDYNGGVKPESDKFKNTWYKAGHGPTKVLLSAHIDEISAVVTSISEDGTLTVGQQAGMDKKDISASEVLLIRDDFTTVNGIAIKNPIHVELREETYDKVTKFEDLRIDIGCETKDEVVKRGIHPGTPVVYARTGNTLFGKNRFYGVGLDDKIGVFVAEEIFRDLLVFSENDNWKEKYTVYCMAAAQEESGCRGVCSAVKTIDPDISIDFDVTVATDGDMGLSKAKYGDISLGKGAVICHGPANSVRLNMVLKKGIKWISGIYQEMASGRAGGTNTDNIQKFSRDCETTLVSIPNRSMHTRVETCDWRDVQSAVDMVSQAITSCSL